MLVVGAEETEALEATGVVVGAAGEEEGAGAPGEDATWAEEEGAGATEGVTEEEATVVAAAAGATTAEEEVQATEEDMEVRRGQHLLQGM